VHGRLFPVEGDWYEWRQEPPLAGTVTVRVSVTASGRVVLAGLRVDGAPTADLLRAIPVGRIEAAANAQLVVVDDALVPVSTSKRPRPTGPPRGSAAGWEAPDPRRAVDRPRAPASRRMQGRPDQFYRQIADVYVDLAQATHRPASELASTHGVPVTTAHRWVKEARRRGFLPPGRPGTTG
jgi:hypothetical protein